MVTEKKNIFNLDFDALTLTEATTQITEAARNGRKGLVVTPNVDHIVVLESDNDLRKTYHEALFIFADGMPIVWLSKFLTGKKLPERVTGADLFNTVCESATEHGLRIMLMGGMPGIANRAAENLKKKFTRLNIVGTYCPPVGFDQSEAETVNMINYCNDKAPDILFFGVGFPKQEKWAYANMHRLKVGPILCVGAAIDFAAGNIQRAPELMQKTGFEWLWRLLSEPKRLWKRYLIRDSRFIFLAAREITRHLKSSRKLGIHL